MINEEILSGVLLGDGNLRLGVRSKNASFTYTSKEKDHVDFVFKYFKEFCTNNEIKFTSYFDKRTNKTYSRYYFTTKSLPIFTNYYNKWYINKKKIIPDEITLSNDSLLLWYIGDGHLRKDDNRIILSTNCFPKEQIKNIIIPKLKRFKPKIGYQKNKQPIIIIPREAVDMFLSEIGPCPFISYAYKWDIKPYKIKGRIGGIHKTTKEELDKFIQLYENGMTYYAIAKLFNYSPSRIVHALMRCGKYLPTKRNNYVNR